MRKDVLEVADEDLPAAAVELLGNGPYEGGCSGGGLGCQVGEENLQGALRKQHERRQSKD